MTLFTLSLAWLEYAAKCWGISYSVAVSFGDAPVFDLSKQNSAMILEFPVQRKRGRNAA